MQSVDGVKERKGWAADPRGNRVDGDGARGRWTWLELSYAKEEGPG
jgi:hypothetical protein